MNRSIRVCSAMALLVGLSACGGGSDEPASAPPPTAAPTPPAPAPTPPAPAPAPTPPAPAPAPTPPAPAPAPTPPAPPPAPTPPPPPPPPAPAPPPSAAVPLAPGFDFSAASTDELIMQRMVGEYTVAITDAPDLSEIGIGTLVVSYAGSDGEVALELRSASGTSLARRSSPALSDRRASDGRGITLWDTAVEAGFNVGYGGPGRRLGIYNYYDAGNTNASPIAYARTDFLGSGYLVGQVSSYSFRNSVQHVGTDVPAVFASLAGTYQARAQALTCAPNPITVTITDTGTVRVQGKSSINCATQDLLVTWDGRDDYVFTDGSGQVILVLDGQFGGGSQPGGGLVIKLPQLTAPTTFTELHTNFAGAAGGITALEPTRP